MTKAQQNKARRDAFFKLNVDLTQSAKKALTSLEDEKVEEVMVAYMSLLSSETEESTIEVEVDVMKQMALLAGVTLSRIIIERYR